MTMDSYILIRDSKNFPSKFNDALKPFIHGLMIEAFKAHKIGSKYAPVLKKITDLHAQVRGRLRAHTDDEDLTVVCLGLRMFWCY